MRDGKKNCSDLSRNRAKEPCSLCRETQLLLCPVISVIFTNMDVLTVPNSYICVLRHLTGKVSSG